MRLQHCTWVGTNDAIPMLVVKAKKADVVMDHFITSPASRCAATTQAINILCRVSNQIRSGKQLAVLFLFLGGAHIQCLVTVPDQVAAFAADYVLEGCTPIRFSAGNTL